MIGAKARLAVLVKVADAIRRAESGTGAEAEIAAASALPPNYDHRDRVALAREGEEQFTGLKNLLNDPKSPKGAIASKWVKFQKNHPKHVPLLEASQEEPESVHKFLAQRIHPMIRLAEIKKIARFGLLGAVGCLAGWLLGEPLLALSLPDATATGAPSLVSPSAAPAAPPEFKERLEKTGAKSGSTAPRSLVHVK